MQKVYRLTNNAGFNYIYRRGERISSPLMSIIFVKAASIKVGVSVSKKVGGSVVRSHVKRLINENFRALIPDLTVKANYVVVAYEKIATEDFHTIGKDLTRLLTKAGHLAERAE